jgi:hypothetical protein
VSNEQYFILRGAAAAPAFECKFRLQRKFCAVILRIGGDFDTVLAHFHLLFTSSGKIFVFASLEPKLAIICNLPDARDRLAVK